MKTNSIITEKCVPRKHCERYPNGYNIHAFLDPENPNYYSLLYREEVEKEDGSVGITRSFELVNIDHTTEEDLDILGKVLKQQYDDIAKLRTCTTEVLMQLLDMNYEDTYMLQAKYGAKYKLLPNFIGVTWELLKDRGYKPIGSIEAGSEFLTDDVGKFIEEHMEGKYLLYLIINRSTLEDPNSNKRRAMAHTVALINGVVYTYCYSKFMSKSEPIDCLISGMYRLLNRYDLKACMELK